MIYDDQKTIRPGSHTLPIGEHRFEVTTDGRDLFRVWNVTRQEYVWFNNGLGHEHPTTLRRATRYVERHGQPQAAAPLTPEQEAARDAR